MATADFDTPVRPSKKSCKKTPPPPAPVHYTDARPPVVDSVWREASVPAGDPLVYPATKQFVGGQLRNARAVLSVCSAIASGEVADHLDRDLDELVLRALTLSLRLFGEVEQFVDAHRLKPSDSYRFEGLFYQVTALAFLLESVGFDGGAGFRFEAETTAGVLRAMLDTLDLVIVQVEELDVAGTAAA